MVRKNVKDTGPLVWNVPIVDRKGLPSPEFQRRWDLQRGNNALIGTISFGDGPPTGTPEDGAEYVDITADPPVLYIGNGGAWIRIGVFEFTQLEDVPSSYSGAGSKILQVNSGATGIQFTSLSSLTANPTATAGPTVINGTASTFMRSDAAPAVQIGSDTQKGLLQVDGTTITASSGVISAVAVPGGVTTTGTPASGNLTKFSGASTITNGDLTGAVLTSGTLVTTFGDLAALSVLGRSANSVGTPAAITTTAGSKAVLRETGSTVAFGSLSGLLDDTLGSTQGSVIYRNASTWTVLTPGTSGQALTTGGTGANPSWAYATGANPFIIGAAYIRTGTGTPGPADPIGSLYLQTDVPGLFRALIPTSAVPARVQEAEICQSYTVTFGSALTAGNYLVAVGFRNDALPSANTGWTSKATSNPTGSNDPYMRVVYKLIASGESSVQTPFTGAGSVVYGTSVCEVSGLDSITFDNSYQTTIFASANGTTTSFSATATTTTTSANTLGLAFVGHTGAMLNSTFSDSAGWTNGTDATGSNSITLIRTRVSNKLFASIGTAADTVTNVTSTSTGRGIGIAMVLLQPSASSDTTGWLRVSDLTTIKSSGSSITTAARSIDFTNLLSATSDAYGHVTVTYGTGAALSVLGRSANSSGTLADISTTASSNKLLREKSSALSWDTLSNLMDDVLGGTQGDIIYRNATGWVVANAGTSGYVWTTAGPGANPSWQVAPGAGGGGGTVTSITINTPYLTGGTITTTGTVDFDVAASGPIEAAQHMLLGGI